MSLPDRQPETEVLNPEETERAERFGMLAFSLMKASFLVSLAPSDEGLPTVSLTITLPPQTRKMSLAEAQSLWTDSEPEAAGRYSVCLPSGREPSQLGYSGEINNELAARVVGLIDRFGVVAPANQPVVATV